MRQLEPFSYFAGHASALAGFGGPEAAPDPRYFFHTRYETVRPGRAIYHLAIKGARATTGELTLRVHAFKPGAAGEISLAGGGRLSLGGVQGQAEATHVPIRFSAAPDSHYALYGYFSEPTDLVADAIEIAIEELGGPADAASAQRSSRAEATGGFAAIAKLCSDAAPSLLQPVSQPCTEEQLAPDILDALWPSIPGFAEDRVERWKLVMPLQALTSAGMRLADARGLILDAPHASLAAALREQGAAIDEARGGVDTGAWTEADGGGGHDFVIAYEPPRPAGPAARSASLPERIAPQVMKGGLAVAIMAIDPDQEAHAFRNGLQQIALRLIGRGHDVAQLRVPHALFPFARTGPTGAFAFIIKG
jgi:hypothetical protein